MTPSRNRILTNLRAHTDTAPALPDHDGPWIRFADRVQTFCQSVNTVSGQAQVLSVAQDSDHTLATALAQLPVVKNSPRICSLIPQVPGTIDLQTVDDPHTLADLDLTIAQASLGVAENAALWITDHNIRHRAALFIAQHVVFVVHAADLVDNMHDAYQRIHPGNTRFGVFISGPSKTADIEQSLVTGAHGPRSATVIILANRD